MKLYSAIIFLILLVFNTSCSKESINAPPVQIQPIVTDDPVIGIFTGNGAESFCYLAAEQMFMWMNYEVERLVVQDINGNSERFQGINLIYFPGGSSGPYMMEISGEGKERLRSRIAEGMAYIGTCAGALFAMDTIMWQGYHDNRGSLAIFPGRSEGPCPEIFEYPEIGMCRVDYIKSHPVTENLEDYDYIMYYNGPYFVPRINSGAVILGRYSINNYPAIVAYEYGTGRVFLTGPHPEWEEDDARDGVAYFDSYRDRGSDWPMMRAAARWCLYQLN